jgi:predicted enzyme related to lactoylglutathione lyase
MATNAINWFEIPVSNLERATKFYASILGSKLEPMEAMGMRMAFLPMERGGVGGSLVQADGYVPTTQGVYVYLNGGEDLNTILRKVEASGGKIAQPKTGIGENGFIAFFLDTEGNKVGLHSMH